MATGGRGLLVAVVLVGVAEVVRLYTDPQADHGSPLLIKDLRAPLVRAGPRVPNRV